MTKIEFVTKNGSVVTFNRKPKRKQSDSSLTPYQRLVRKVSAAHPELHGKDLFKKVSKVYRAKKASHAKEDRKKSSVRKSAKKSMKRSMKKSGKRSGRKHH